MNRRFPLVMALAFLVGGQILSWRQGGDTPVVWYDTLVDQGLVDSCANQGSCIFEGVGASVAGPRVGAGWHLVRNFMHAVGVSPTGVHWAANVAEGLVIPVTAIAGWYAGGIGAGAIGAIIAAVAVGSGGIHHSVLYNSRPASFIGALFVLLAILAVGSRRLHLLAMAAAVAGVAVAFHPVNGFLGVSAVALFFLFPDRRLKAFLVASAAFGITAFLASPWMWIQNLLLLTGGWKPQASSFAAMDGLAWKGIALIAGSAMVAGLVQIPRRISGQRDGAIWSAVTIAILPLFLVFVLAARTGTVENSQKYLIVLAAPAGLALGWTAWRLLAGLAALVSRGAISRWMSGLGGRVAAWSFAVACAIAVAALPVDDYLKEPPVVMDRLTLKDIDLLSGYLAGPGAWGGERAYRGIIGPRDREALVTMRLLAPLPEIGANDDQPPSTLVFLKVRQQRLPERLPESWRVLDRDRGRVLLLVPLDGWIDRTRFEACYQRAGQADDTRKCMDVRFSPETRHEGGTPGRMEPVPPAQPTTVTMRFALKVSGDSRAGVLVMPRLPLQCSGRIVAVQGIPADISADGFRARLTSVSGDETGDVLLAWDAAGPDCPGWAFSGFPPFFLEGDTATVEALEYLLQPVD